MEQQEPVLDRFHDSSKVNADAICWEKVPNIEKVC